MELDLPTSGDVVDWDLYISEERILDLIVSLVCVFFLGGGFRKIALLCARG